MKILVLNILLAFIWMFVSGRFTSTNFFFGYLCAYFFLWISFRNQKTGYFEKIPKLVKLLFFFLKEMLIANLRVTYHVLTPKHRMKPGILAVPIESDKEIEITLLSNMITLTPGTLALDVSPDRKTLFVHFIYIENPEKVKQAIHEFEKRILDVLR